MDVSHAELEFEFPEYMIIGSGISSSIFGFEVCVGFIFWTASHCMFERLFFNFENISSKGNLFSKNWTSLERKILEENGSRH